ncbi:hypothetical protein HDV01_001206 [Terramyces sp. JEL0728]|nr:hypothetical protein HDV01_001206 [Terramyces sp. JEL0728]
MTESQGEKYSRLVKQINIPPSQLNTPFGRLAVQLKEYNANPNDTSTLNSIKTWFTFLPTGTAIVCGIAAYRFARKKNWKWYSRLIYTTVSSYAGMQVSVLVGTYIVVNKFKSTGYGQIFNQWRLEEELARNGDQYVRLTNKQVDEWINANSELINAFTKFRKSKSDRQKFDQDLFKKDSEFTPVKDEFDSSKPDGFNTGPPTQDGFSTSRKIAKVNQYGDVVEEDPKI